MNKLFINTFILSLLFIISGCQAESPKIEVLIVDGFNNHNWQQNTSLVKSILEETGLFNVSVSTSPSESGDPGWETWRPAFDQYDVIIQNSNNIRNKELRWPGEVEDALADYVKSGGGLYILHSANNAFADWHEYNLMIGLGWRSPDEGIALQVSKDGEIIQIPSGEGEKTFHGPRNDEIIYKLKDHPINKDFPDEWLTPNVELYKFARGPAENLSVLSYAKDDETNINWPVEWVVAYGKGRVYNSSLGHLWKGETYPDSYRCIGYQTTMIRATEWLARGKTSYDIPSDFPTASAISLKELP